MSDETNEFAERYGAWAIVCGASDGTGSAFAADIAARGVNVVLVARRRQLLDEVAADLPTETRVVTLDLSAADAAAELAAATADLDVGLLVYNAGADDHVTPLLEHTIDDLRALVRRNCSTVLELCHAIGGRLVARGRGGVVLVSSGAAWSGGGGIAAYSATKAFDLMLAQSLWAEWSALGVDVLALVLGGTDTPSLRRVLELHGGEMPVLAHAIDVVREGLDHLADGPTWNIGMPDPAGASPLSSLPPGTAVELVTQVTASMHGPRTT